MSFMAALAFTKISKKVLVFWKGKSADGQAERNVWNMGSLKSNAWPIPIDHIPNVVGAIARTNFELGGAKNSGNEARSYVE